MRFAAALSEHPVAAVAVGETAGELLERLDGPPDLVVLVAGAPHAGALDDVAGAVGALLAPGVLLGAAAAGVVGGRREVASGPALALWAARLGGPVTPVRLAVDPLGALDVDALVVAPGDHTLVLLADPFGAPVPDALARLGRRHPDLTVVGGLASSGRGPGGSRLVLDGQVLVDGAVGVLLGGAPRPVAVVSQGCRPIGSPLTVTRAERGMVYELGGRPALERLLEAVEQLSPADRALAARGLHCGIVVDEHRLEFGPGDFLVRGVLGADRAVGAVAVADEVPVGTTVQFQVRDGRSADTHLRRTLAGHPAGAALLFTCTGRGSQLFGRPHHDATVLSDLTGAAAVAGMASAAEIGPVAGRAHLHTFSAAAVLFGHGA